VAKGFKGKYFSLTAIQALVSEIKLSSQASRMAYCRYDMRCESEDEDPPPDIEDLMIQIEPFAPRVSRCQCHCNCFFKGRTRCALLHAFKVPKIRFLFNIYSTDLAPPSLILFYMTF